LQRLNKYFFGILVLSLAEREQKKIVSLTADNCKNGNRQKRVGKKYGQRLRLRFKLLPIFCA